MDIVYIETSVISHATARPSSDPTTLALQQQAKRWLTEQRPLYDVVTSQLVIDEASFGDPDAARRRLSALDGIPVLPANLGVDLLARSRRSAAIGLKISRRLGESNRYVQEDYFDIK